MTPVKFIYMIITSILGGLILIYIGSILTDLELAQGACMGFGAALGGLYGFDSWDLFIKKSTSSKKKTLKNNSWGDESSMN